MIKSQYPYEVFMEVTKKWWIKILIILFITLAFFGIWLLQPRFGRSFMDFDTTLTYGYQSTQKTDTGKTYTFQSEVDQLIIKTTDKTYIIEFGGTTYVITSVTKNEMKVVDAKTNLPVDLSELTLKNALLTNIITSDSHNINMMVILFLTFLVQSAIAMVFVFFAPKLTYFGIIAKPVLVNNLIGLGLLVSQLISSFRLL